jgi:predicted dehydrogenase
MEDQMNNRVNKPIQIAVIGCGYWGPNLIRNFSFLSDCNVHTVCDLKDDRLAHMKQLYPEVETSKEFEQAVQTPDIDAIVIATPVRFHFEMAKAVLQAGKHVFIEKPMASSVAECKELIKLAETQNLTIMLGHTFIYSPPVRRVKEIIDSGDIGEIQYISSRRLNLGLFQTDINVAWDLAPHDISIILYILGQLPDSVNCQGKAHVNPKIEDVTNMTLNFANGGFATIQSSWLDPNKVREMTFVGSKRMLVYDDLQPMEKIKIYDKRVETPPHYDTFAEFHYSYHYGDMYAPYIKQYEPLRMECQEFLNSIKTGLKPETGSTEGLQVIQILEAASKSLKNDGALVKIDRVDPMEFFIEQPPQAAVAAH